MNIFENVIYSCDFKAEFLESFVYIYLIIKIFLCI